MPPTRWGSIAGFIWQASTRHASEGSRHKQPTFNRRHVLVLAIFVLVIFPIAAIEQFNGASLCISDGVTMGYNNFYVLRNDILARNSLSIGTDGGVFILCPFTLFSIDTLPLVVSANDTIIKCGNDGSHWNGCVLDGGPTHMIISGDPYQILIQGLTFRNSSKTSVIIAVGQAGSITFDDCRWEGVGGYSALTIDDVSAPPSMSPSEGLPRAPPSMVPHSSSIFPSSSPSITSTRPSVSEAPSDISLTLEPTTTSTAVPTTSTNFPSQFGTPMQSFVPSGIKGTLLPTTTINSSPSAEPLTTNFPSQSAFPTTSPYPTSTLTPSYFPLSSDIPRTLGPTTTMYPTQTAIPTTTYFPSQSGFPTASLYPTTNVPPKTRTYPSTQRVLESEALTVSIDNCAFVESAVSSSLIVQSLGSVLVSSTLFQDNVAAESAVTVSAGDFSLLNSTFKNNTLKAIAAVVLAPGSTLGRQVGNCGENSVNGSCTGIFVGSTGDCTDAIDNCEGACYPFLNTSCPVESCFANWKDFARAVKIPITIPNGRTFILCPKTLFNLSDIEAKQFAPAIVQQSSTRISCGEDGRRDNSCVIQGGVEQVVIQGSASNVQFKGLTFVGSTGVSVAASGTSSASAAFTDCEWKENSGNSVVLMYSGGIDSILRHERAPVSLLTIPPPDRQSMRVFMLNCSLIANRVALGPIANFHGTLSVIGSYFEGNEGEFGAISSIHGGKMELSNSCFVSNVATRPLATVFVNQGSIIYRQDNNFGRNNSAPTSPCVDVYAVDDDSCLDDIGGCDNACQAFEGSACVATDNPPTSTPSRMPISAPPSISPSTSSVPSLSQFPLGTTYPTEPSSSTTSSPTLNPSRSGGPSIGVTYPVSLTPSLTVTPPFSQSPSATSYPATTLIPTLGYNTSVPTAFSSSVSRTVPCDTNGSYIGYNNQASFLLDVADSVAGVYLLCPDTSFDNMELVIGSSATNMTVTCANTSIGCIWESATHHIVVEGNLDEPVNLAIQGVTFKNAKNASIMILAEFGAVLNISFHECTWAENGGSAALLINTSDTGANGVGGRRLENETNSVAVNLSQCLFVANYASLALVASYAGVLGLTECSFQINRVEGSIVSSFKGSTAIGGSRFEGNVYSASQGIIFIGQDSMSNATVADSCEANNRATYDSDSVSTCGGILIQTPSTCLEGSDSSGGCNNTCLPIEPCFVAQPTTSPIITPQQPSESSSVIFFQEASYESSGTFLSSILVSVLLLTGGVGAYVWINRQRNGAPANANNRISRRRQGQVAVPSELHAFEKDNDDDESLL